MPDEEEPKENVSSDRAASIYAEFLARIESGEGSDIAELYQRCPELESELQGLHQAHMRAAAALSKLHLAGPLVERIKGRFGPEVDPEITLEIESGRGSDFSSDVVRRLASRPGSFGRYRIKGEFERGGMGAILRVWDEDLRRHLAMKVMLGKADPDAPGDTPKMNTRALGRFLEEAQVTGQLDHPGIVPVHELGLTPEGRMYFTMKLVKGRTLRQILGLLAKGEEEWTQARTLNVVLKVCEAVSYAHAKNVLHRDLKPANIMVGRFGEVYVMDWGLAKIIGRRDEKDIRIREEPEATELGPEGQEKVEIDPEIPLYTMDGDVVGTPAYMSPEQADGRVDELSPQSDIYSIGAILYHLISGRMPYAGGARRIDNYIIWRRVKAGSLDSLSTLAPGAPPELVSICEKAMMRNPLERYSSVRELAEELQAYLEGRVVPAHRTGLAIELRKWVERNRLAAGALAAAVLLLLGGSATVYGVQSSKLRAVETEQAQTLAASKRAKELAEAAAASEAAALAQQKENLVLQADYAIENANLEEVEVLMAEFRGLAPEDFLPHLVLARGYSQYLRTAEAERELHRARDKGYVADVPDPNDARGLYLRGLALVIERDPAERGEAIRCLGEAIRLDTQVRAAYFPLYSLHKESGDLVAAEAALAAFQEILATGDDYYDVVDAIRAELQGRYQDAVDVLLKTEREVGEERAVELRLSRILGRLYLALASEGAGGRPSAVNLDAADERLQAAVASVPSDAASWANLGLLEVRRFWLDPAAETADDHLRRALEAGRRAILEYPQLAPGHRVILNALVFMATRTFDPGGPDFELFEEAREVAGKLRALDPRHPSLDLMEAEIDFHLGMHAEVMGDNDRVEELYRRSVSLNPNQVLPRFWLAQRAFLREDFEASLEQLQAARSVLSRYADEDVVRALPDVFRIKVHVWTLGAAGRVPTPEAIEIGLDARDDIEAALESGLEVETIDLLNYVEFLATSPSPELRDCEGAELVFENYSLGERLRGSLDEDSVRAVEAALRDCE